jgi:CheY-like chemotaxis protein
MKILVIDDEPDIRTYLSVLFEENGHEVVTAADGTEGLAQAKAQKPDLITLDILMPEKSGIKLYRELRKSEELGTIPIVIITGVATVAPAFHDFERFIKSRRIRGPDGYVEKPVQADDLVRLVGELAG